MAQSLKKVQAVVLLALAGLALTSAGCDGLKAGFNSGIEDSINTIITQTVVRVFHLE
ncbi:MAG: hypothetical protein IT449_16395 [Phycisphaerales bacterium]|nr:hypothetical protein [Phycisphaerales bacterium]